MIFLIFKTLPEISKNEIITIYPNPTESYINIESFETPIAIIIYNVLGEKVITKTNTNKIDVKDLESGIYIINITNSLGSINKKFVKIVR